MTGWFNNSCLEWLSSLKQHVNPRSHPQQRGHNSDYFHVCLCYLLFCFYCRPALLTSSLRGVGVNKRSNDVWTFGHAATMAPSDRCTPPITHHPLQVAPLQCATTEELLRPFAMLKRSDGGASHSCVGPATWFSDSDHNTTTTSSTIFRDVSGIQWKKYWMHDLL